MPAKEIFRSWIEAETGMDFSGNRVDRLNHAISKVLPSVDGKFDFSRPECREQTRFVERLTAELTVGESFFFRNDFHFRALRNEVLPLILRENADRREIRVWSAGCATGEEPYSIAILLEQVLAEQFVLDPSWSVSILGTDLNPAFLRRAGEARYRAWSFRNTQIHRNKRLFAVDGDFFCLHPRLRRLVHFLYLNLVKDVYPSPLNGTLGLDLILFRNVAIYLKPEVTADVVRRLYQSLRPGGWLLPGETEISFIDKRAFEVHRFEQATFLRKPDSGLTTSRAYVPFEQLPIRQFQRSVIESALGEFSAAQNAPARPLSPSFFAAPTQGPFDSGVRAPTEREIAVVRQRPVPREIEPLPAADEATDAERRIAAHTALDGRIEERIKRSSAPPAFAESAQARDVLEQCLKENPLSLEAHLLYAGLMDEAGDLDAAEAGYRRALYVDRNCVIVHFLLALVRRRKGDDRGAVHHLENTLQLLEGKGAHELVEYGDGICCGRLREMVETAFEF